MDQVDQADQVDVKHGGSVEADRDADVGSLSLRLDQEQRRSTALVCFFF